MNSTVVNLDGSGASLPETREIASRKKGSGQRAAPLCAQLAGGNTGPRVLGENRGSAAAEIIGRKRLEDAGGSNGNGIERVHDFIGLISAPTRAHV